jgi:hypothetical protein
VGQARRCSVDGEPEGSGLAFRSADSFFDDEPGTAPGAGSRPVLELPRSRRSAGRWLRPGLAAGLAAAVLVVIAFLPRADGLPQIAVGPSTTGPASHGAASAAQILHAAGEASAVGTDDASDAVFWRAESVVQQGSDEPVERTVWTGRREPGAVIDGAARRDLPAAALGLRKAELTWDELVALPLDPVALRRALERDVGGQGALDWQVATLVGEMLAETPSPPPLRQALWGVLAEIPGMTLTGETRDARGRAGVAIRLAADDTWTADPATVEGDGYGDLELIVDSQSGAILQMTVAPRDADGDPHRTTFVSQGPAREAP